MMFSQLIWILLVSFYGKCNTELLDIPKLPDKVYEYPGDINIGGIFPLHQPGQNGTYCGDLRELGVLQRAEAMAFFINQINDDLTLLPNVKLGFTILDDCYKETTALAQSLKFVQRSDRSSASRGNDSSSEVVAVIGAESSANSKQIAELLGLFEIPQVSYLSTSPRLTDEIAYPFFTRIVPSDEFQVAAMIAVLQEFQWRYVSFVYIMNFYGWDAYLLLSTELKKHDIDICLAEEINLPETPTSNHYENAVKQLFAKERERASAHHVVILFLPQVVASTLLRTAQKMNYKGHFTWIASDAWGRNVQDFYGIEEIAEGTLTLKINSTNDAEFDKHFSSINPKESSNPFAQEFWQALCENGEKCQRERFSDLPSYKPETTVSLVKLAVYLIAYRLDDLQRECLSDKNATTRYICEGPNFKDYFRGKDLQQKLRGTRGCIQNTCINVDQNGEGKSQYSLMNFQKTRDGNYTLDKVGYYDTADDVQKLHMLNDPPNIYWNSFIPKSLVKNGKPESLCSYACVNGQKQVRSLNFLNSKCCWTCENCAANEVTIEVEIDGLNTTQCEICQEYKRNNTSMVIFSAPESTGAVCQAVVPMSLSPKDPAALVIIIIAILLIAATVVLVALYTANREHRLIKATSLELSYIIWCGILFSYVSVLFYFMPLQVGCDSSTQCNPAPNTHWCYVQYITFSMASTIITAPMITRANRIYRIFEQGKKHAKKPRFIENKYQFAFVAIIISVQIIVVLVCSLASGMDVHPSTTISISNYLDEENLRQSYIACEIPYQILLPPVIFNFILGLVCAYHAFKTRLLPDNFNESKFIGMTIYTTVVMWMAFVPAYIVISSRYHKVIPLCVALIINAVITTVFLFVPRLYALRWVDRGRMNLRTLSISTTSISGEHKSSIQDRKFSLSMDSLRTRTTVTNAPSDSFKQKACNSPPAGQSYISDSTSMSLYPVDLSSSSNTDRSSSL